MLEPDRSGDAASDGGLGAAWLRSSRRKEDPSVARKRFDGFQFRAALSQDDDTRLASTWHLALGTWYFFSPRRMRRLPANAARPGRGPGTIHPPDPAAR
jgi:hypothetical protein